jgi:2,4-dienoyl-CoA reductase-like NADH-dependent reductase (Old Yellow Enzyme family)
VEGGWQIEDSVSLAKQLGPLGVDLIDCSSGGTSPHASVPLVPGYQVPFAERVRRDAGILTGAVGLITSAEQAEQILQNGQADFIFLARAVLRNPHWALDAAVQLHEPVPVPAQYKRAYPI